MEQDRFAQNKTLFVLGIISMIAFFSLFAFTVYIFPALIWKLNYDVPEFVIMGREGIRAYIDVSEREAGFILFFLLLALTFITGYISKVISNSIDDKIYKTVDELTESTPKTSPPKNISESFGFGAKLLFFLIIVLLAVWLVEWLVNYSIPEY